MAVSARDAGKPPAPPVTAEGGRHRKSPPDSAGSQSKARPGGGWRFLRETTIIIVSALVLSAVVRAFLIQAFYVPSASMEATLMPNDRIIAAKISTRLTGVHRGEVMVFEDPGGWLPEPEKPVAGLRSSIRAGMTFIGLLPSDTGQDLVKRVMAVGGDRIACCDDRGRIVLNGVPLDETYIQGPTDQVRFDVVVPPNSMFMMGDNRGNSRDSRFHLDVNDGAVPVHDAVGRSVLTIWPFERFATQPIPDIFGNPAITGGQPN